MHRIGPIRSGTVTGLALVGAGDFSFGLRERPDDTLVFSDHGDHNEANSLGTTTAVTGNPLRALARLARDVRRSGIREAGDVVVDDRLFVPHRGWPDGPITPIWVNENLIDITVTPTSAGRAARVVHRPRTAAYRVDSRVRTGDGTDLRLSEPRPGVIRIEGTIDADGGPTVRSWLVEDPADFARTAFIQELRRAGVRVDARSTGDNPTTLLPGSRRYPASTRLGQWTSPPLSEYIKVIFKTSYNRGADLMACLVGVRGGTRSCENGVARVTRRAIGLGVPGDQFFNFDGAGSLEANAITPAALDTLNAAGRTQPWAGVYRDALPVLGVAGGGSLSFLGKDSPARGKLRAKTGTRILGAPGSPVAITAARGLSGYLEGASGREYEITMIVNRVPFATPQEGSGVNTDQIDVVSAIYRGS